MNGILPEGKVPPSFPIQWRDGTPERAKEHQVEAPLQVNQQAANMLMIRVILCTGT
jgi:hypothetical protein